MRDEALALPRQRGEGRTGDAHGHSLGTHAGLLDQRGGVEAVGGQEVHARAEDAGEVIDELGAVVVKGPREQDAVGVGAGDAPREPYIPRPVAPFGRAGDRDAQRPRGGCRVGCQADPVVGPVVEKEEATHSEPAATSASAAACTLSAAITRAKLRGRSGSSDRARRGRRRRPPGSARRRCSWRWRSLPGRQARGSDAYLVRGARRGVRADDADHAAIAGVAPSVGCALGGDGGHGERTTASSQDW